MKESKLITFSGGCLSGKTSSMDIIKERLIKEGYTVKILSELIRPKISTTIDEIRNKPLEYLKLQDEVTTLKIAEEQDALYSGYDYVLIDRSIIDSLFYLQFYTAKQAFSTKDWTLYLTLMHKIEKHISWALFWYRQVLFFEPLDVMCFDSVYRPSNIDVLKHIESKSIYRLLLGYSFKPALIDLKIQNVNNIKIV